MDAFEAAFKETPVLLRYPGPENAERAFGYHDDSFAWATLPTGKPGDNWFFVARMREVGPAACEKWKTRPIGGETRPEIWRKLWEDETEVPKGQEFLRCVKDTHASWLMDSSIVRPLNEAQMKRAIQGARKLGYEFRVTSGRVKRGNVRVTIRNTGVAPFYRNWPVKLAALDQAGKAVAVWETDWKLTGLLPGDPDRVWEHDLDLKRLPPGRYRLALSVPNPMAGGQPLRFANRAQDKDSPGVLALGTFEKKSAGEPGDALK
jgi:hypothetical protein